MKPFLVVMLLLAFAAGTTFVVRQNDRVPDSEPPPTVEPLAVPVLATVDKIEPFTLEDYLGAEHSLAEWQGKKAIVVVFLGAECPLAKLYGQRLAEMSAQYEPRGVQFVGINANRQDTLAEIAHYAKTHQIEFPLLKDPSQKVADLFGAYSYSRSFCA